MDAKSSRIKRPTSMDVARLAGVSKTTVSLVINNSPTANISQETRARIHDAIAQLDYHPHEMARNLSNKASHILNAAFPDAKNPHFLQIFEGIEAYAKSEGYGVFLSFTQFDLQEEKRCFDWLKQKRNDALIISSSTGKILIDEIRAIRDYGYVVTTLTPSVPQMYDATIDSVVSEPRRGEGLLLDHLIELGHRHVGYIYGVTNHDILDERLKACLEAQRERGLPVVADWICRCGPTQEEGYKATKALLEQCEGKERPTALIVVNDLLASAVLNALFGVHISVPAEMSVASFDNIPSAAYTIPPLTTVDYDAYALGEQAARLTIERLAHLDRPPVYSQLPARLIIRDSTGSAPAKK